MDYNYEFDWVVTKERK